MPAHDRALYVEVPQMPAEGAFAHLDRFWLQVHPVQFEQVERTKGHGMVMPPVPDQLKYR